MNQYHTDHIPFRNAIKLEANYKNTSFKRETMFENYKNTSELFMDQNKNHYGNLEISEVD